MNLPDAPIAHEGFFATHFFSVSGQCLLLSAVFLLA
jgi:hypothetical protein